MRVFSALLALALAPVPAHAQGQLLGELHNLVPPFTDETDELAVEDLNGDGVPDLFVANADQDRVHLNTGAGRFLHAAGALPVDDSYSQSVALGDVDSDGDADALVGKAPAFGTSKLLFNDGSAVFTDSSASLPPHAGSAEKVFLEDVDADGYLDVVLLHSTNAGALGFGYGTGSFVPGAGVPQRPILDGAIGDVDGDSDLDILVGLGTPSTGVPNELYKLVGSGYVLSPTTPVNFVPSYGVELADVDLDGDLDGVIGNSGLSRIYANDGLGNFTEALGALPPVLLSLPPVSVGDVDLDGDVDALISTTLFLNDGSGTFGLSTNPDLVGSSKRENLLADVDGDGDLDAFVSGGAQTVYGSLTFLNLNDGSGSFAPVVEDVPSPPPSSFAAAVADVDGDGDIDAFGGGGFNAVNRLLVNDGTGFFADASDQLPVTGTFNTGDVLLEDLDGDGDADVLRGNGGFNQLFRNEGTGTFVNTSLDLPQHQDDTEGLDAGDVDGDGDVDLLVANDGQNRLYRQLGDATFQDTGALPFEAGDTYDGALFDADGDGDLDVLFGNFSHSFPPVSGQNRLLLGDGAGAFVDVTETSLPAMSNKTTSLAVGDADADGDLDVFVGNALQQNNLLANDGSGGFADATAQLPPAGDQTYAVAFIDPDGDGDLDALSGNTGEEDVRFLENDGAGFFALAQDAIPRARFVNDFAVGDLDGDGDQDVLLSSRDHIRVWRSLDRQVAWGDAPRLGKTYTLEVYGPPGEPWFLAWSLAPASIPLVPFGTLRLALGPLKVDSSGFLDANGFASRSFVGPTDPVWVGSSLYWQQISGFELTFSNLELTTFADL